MDPIVRELSDRFGREALLSASEVAQRASSFWDPRPLAARALVRPSSTAEVSRLLSLCYERRQSVVVQGGRTGACGGERSRPADLILSLERMNRVEDVDSVERTVTVQAGCILEIAQNSVAAQGLRLPVDLGARASCTIGGNIATNAGGINVIRHGMMREHVRGLEAVIADGTVVSSMNRMLKNNAGYDVKQLFIGTEGTLGVVTRAVLSLEEGMPHEFDALAGLRDFEAVARFLRQLYGRLGGELVAFEVMWSDYYRAVTAASRHSPPLEPVHAYYVLIKSISGAEDARATFELALEQALESGIVEDAVVAKSKDEARRLWSIREEFESLLRGQPAFVYDVGLPIRRMPSYVNEVRARLAGEWPQGRMYVFGHVGDGNLHLIVSPGEDSADVHARADLHVYEPLRSFAGSISAEHGIGAERRTYLGISRTPEEIALMRDLKRWLDPRNILNPGKVIPDAAGP